MPADAVLHSTTGMLGQDLVLQPKVIRFVREVFFVPSTGQTITVPLPTGYDGAFGPHIQALALALGHGVDANGDAGTPLASTP